jgi:hypothetical protein
MSALSSHDFLSRGAPGLAENRRYRGRMSELSKKPDYLCVVCRTIQSPASFFFLFSVAVLFASFFLCDKTSKTQAPRTLTRLLGLKDEKE